MEYLTILKITHLLGVIGGFGGALFTDYLMIRRGIFRPLRPEHITQIETLSRFVILGLFVLWISGAALAFELISTNQDFMLNGKFWAKVAIVSVLTINGFFIHHVVLKEAKTSVAKRLLIDTEPAMMMVLAITGSVSFMSWTTPFILGKAKEFSYVVPFDTIILTWLAAIFVSTIGIVTMVRLYTWQEKRRASRVNAPSVDEAQIIIDARISQMIGKQSAT